MRVQTCKLEGLLSDIRPVDLVGVGGQEDMPRERLLCRLSITAKLGRGPLECEDKNPFPGKFPLIKYREKELSRLFTGRDTFLEELHRSFRRENIQAVYGLMGMGKTEVTLAYAYRYEHYYHTIIWLDATEGSTLEADCRKALQKIDAALTNDTQQQGNTQGQGGSQNQNAQQQGNVQGQASSQNQVAQTSAEYAIKLKNWLANQSDWLVILDNCNDPKLAQSIVPIEAEGHVLLTVDELPEQQVQAVSYIPLRAMEEDEGVTFLLRVINDSPDIPPVNDYDYTLAREISQRSMGGLPLGILLAGKYIAGPGRNNLYDYLSLYNKHRATLLRNLRNTQRTDPSLRSSNPTQGSEFQTIATTWSVSLEKLRKETRELLQFCAYLAPDPIPEEIFRNAPEFISIGLREIAEDSSLFKSAIEELKRFSLISRIPYVPPKKLGVDAGRQNGFESSNLVVHPLVQDAIREGMYDRNIEIPEGMQRAYAKRALLAVEHAVKHVFPDVEYDTWELCQRYLPHALTCVTYIDRWNIESKEAQRLLYVTGRYLYSQEEYMQASPLLERALLLAWKSSGQYVRDWRAYRKALAGLTIYLDTLAELYHARMHYDQEKSLYERAEALYLLALAIKKDDPERGESHLDTAASLNNLGRLYDDWGEDNQDRIEERYREALIIRMTLLDKQHADVAASYNNLASYYQKQGDRYLLDGDNSEAKTQYSNAQKYYETALNILKAILPSGHPDIIRGMANVAIIKLPLGDDARAEVEYLNVVELTRKKFGADHPLVARRLNNLAEIYRRKNNEQRPLPFWLRRWVRRSRKWYNLAEDAYQEAYTIYQEKFESVPSAIETVVQKTPKPIPPAIETVVRNYAALLKEEDALTNKAEVNDRLKPRDYMELARRRLENFASGNDRRKRQ